MVLSARHPTRCARAAVVVALGVLLVLLATALPAAAHAVLVEADPPHGTNLDRSPTEVTLRFNEPVQAPTGGLRVFDGTATRVDDGPRDTGRSDVLAIALPDTLPDGPYVVAYRVISADGHPVTGVVAFTLGEGAEPDAELIARLLDDGGTVAALRISLRAAGYLATLAAAGAVAFGLLVARRPVEVATARRLGSRSALAGIAVTLLALPVHAAEVGGIGLPDLVTTPAALREIAVSSVGISAFTRMLGLAGLVLAWSPLWRSRPAAPLLLVPAAVAVGSYALDGHQRTVEPAWALVGGDLVHLAAAAVWLGGLAVLAVLLRRAPRDDDPDDPAGAIEVAAVVSRFSGVALGTFGAVAAAGLVMAWALVRTPTALTTTTYGWILVAKVTLVAVVAAVAAYNRMRLVPAIRVAAGLPVGVGGAAEEIPPAAPPYDASTGAPAAWRRLRTTVRVEAGLLVLVLLATGLLVGQRPAADEVGLTGLFQATVALDDRLELDLVVDPNRVGVNTIHVYVLEGGQPSTSATDVAFDVTYLPEGIGPIRIDPFFAGPGHWIASGDELAFRGRWEVRVTVSEGRFTEHVATIPFVVGR